MTENPYKSPEIEIRPFSARFSVFRSIGLGLGFAGILLGVLRYFLSMPGPIAARCEMMGGVMAILGGVSIIFAGLVLNRKSRPRIYATFFLAAFFCLLGFALSGKGYFAESANHRKLDEVKSNLESLSKALERYKSSTSGPKPINETP